MNADAQAYMEETPLTVRRALMDAIAVYDNECGSKREQAIKAIAEGRAAYWTTAKHHNAPAYSMSFALNAGTSIKEVVEDAYRPWCAHMRAGSLDTIVPLNRKAVNALALAYAEIAGDFRDDYELEMRKLRDDRRQGQ